MSIGLDAPPFLRGRMVTDEDLAKIVERPGLVNNFLVLPPARAQQVRYD